MMIDNSMYMMYSTILIALRSEKEQQEKKKKEESNDEDGSIENKIDPIVDTGAAIDAVKSSDNSDAVDAMEDVVLLVDYATQIKVRLMYSLYRRLYRVHSANI